MARPLRVLSLYEGFFAGGARILHTDVVAGLHAGGQRHSVLSIASEARRESTVQPMQDDPRYLRLARAGVEVRTLGRTAGGEPPEPWGFTDDELSIARDAVERADAILSLKEQPLGILLALRERGMMPDVPVAACLHRSDPTHSGPALGWLAAASETGLLTATISCAQTTSDAYTRAAGLSVQRWVVANGIDTESFRPGTVDEIATTKRELGIPDSAPVVVFAARFDAMKNPGLFLRAVACHSRRRPETRYVLCGAGMTWENERFRALVQESDVPPGTQLRALGIRHDMPSIYRVADIVALTSAFGEASPLCLLEGAACGATPVTTNVGDSARQVEGIGAVTSHDPDEIAATWEHVLAHRAAYRDAAFAARPRLGRDRMIDEYRDALDALLQVERAAA
ncbi:glycosyltransferase [Microbacterium ulmi]|uniref:Glycosyltransferase n=1 Tax=Microbacterium ulmi TaxID=179095 RepID=A0A7Y2Q1M6_9MICO|nr:glycosyltransferase [Microbacterium ulmi]NII69918.1 glycosyltransferase involved in cell wall biosynthesis [Microbacterium ulmi]NNH03838.1 glycosyltransferase [Microbacterium ulmi]